MHDAPAQRLGRGLMLRLAPVAALALAVITCSGSDEPSSAERELVAECDSPDPAWIWCDDFEADRLDLYFEYDNPGGDGFVRLDGIGVDGSYGMRVRFAADQVSAGNLHLAFARTPSSYFRPVDDGTADWSVAGRR
ncbi:MAG: hypothetical protein JSV86_16310 [Gemmatimonadota bacterium]|nr:MAG: hypothetical protein JSV86_16310 [Gemmatimonadota bacterium]